MELWEEFFTEINDTLDERAKPRPLARYSQHTGQRNLRYKILLKRRYIEQWSELKERHIPWCRTRYIF